MSVGNNFTGVVTIDETGVHLYDLEVKIFCMQWETLGTPAGNK